LLQQKEDCIIACGKRRKSNILKLTEPMNLLLYYIISTTQTNIEH